MIALLGRLAAAVCGGPDLVPAPLGSEPPPACGTIASELGARASWTTPDPGIATGFDLTRARVEGSAWWGGLAGPRIALAAVRSGGESGYVGVDGESFVARVDIAEVRVAWPRGGIAGALGLVDEAWVELANREWALRPVAATLAQDQGWVEPSDLGAWLAWTAPGGVLSVHVAATTGEGLRAREANEGKNLTGTVVVRPWSGPEGSAPLTVTLWGRDGSVGLGAARDHRAGGRAVVRAAPLVVGLEAVAGWGLAGDASVLPFGASGWVHTSASLPIVGWVRVDPTWADRTEGSTQATSWWVGAGPRVPFRRDAPTALALTLDGARFAPEGAVTPGAGLAAHQTTVSLQVFSALRRDGSLQEAP